MKKYYVRNSFILFALLIISGCGSNSVDELTEEVESFYITSDNVETITASSMTGFKFTSIWSFWLQAFMIIIDDTSTTGDLIDDPCPSGGTVSVKYFDNDNDNDTYEIVFSDCVLSATSGSYTGIIDGEIVIWDKITGVREDIISHDLNIEKPSIGTITLQGSINLNDDIYVSATSPNFRVTLSGIENLSLMLNNLNNRCNRTKVNDEYIHECSGNADIVLSARGVDGEVSYETPIAFKGFDIDNQGQGEMYIDGGFQSYATLATTDTFDLLILEYDSGYLDPGNSELWVTWDQMSLFDVMSISLF